MTATNKNVHIAHEYLLHIHWLIKCWHWCLIITNTSLKQPYSHAMNSIQTLMKYSNGQVYCQQWVIEKLCIGNAWPDTNQPYTPKHEMRYYMPTIPSRTATVLCSHFCLFPWLLVDTTCICFSVSSYMWRNICLISCSIVSSLRVSWIVLLCLRRRATVTLLCLSQHLLEWVRHKHILGVQLAPSCHFSLYYYLLHSTISSLQMWMFAALCLDVSDSAITISVTQPIRNLDTHYKPPY